MSEATALLATRKCSTVSHHCKLATCSLLSARSALMLHTKDDDCCVVQWTAYCCLRLGVALAHCVHN
jgi:hypothetical protein